MTKHAIIVGVIDYPNLQGGGRGSALKGCVLDALKFREFLIDTAGFPAEHVVCLTSPVTTLATGGQTGPATAQGVRDALAAVMKGSAVRSGDQVVLFYAGHGARLDHRTAAGEVNHYYGFLPSDANMDDLDERSLILDREFHAFIAAMAARGAGVTIIADTCHSGSSTRDVDDETARHVEPRTLDEAAWQRLSAAHPAFAAGEAPATRKLGDFGDFVMLAACQDTETARELSPKLRASTKPPLPHHGVLTYNLLDALRRIPADQIGKLRWDVLRDDITRSIARRAGKGEPLQKPSLEGRTEKIVFGGDWQPFDPGFGVLRSSDGALMVDAGIVQGLEEGATIAIYPPDTADFEAAADQAVTATITSATIAFCTAVPTDPNAAVADRSRARLVALAPSTRPMIVRLVDVPPELVAAARAVEHAARWFVPAGGEEPAHVEVRPFVGDVPEAVWSPGERRAWSGARGGWVVVRSDDAGAPARRPAIEPVPEDIIAYLPGGGPRIEALADRTVRLGAALGAGLVQYAKYLRTRDRQSGDITLRSALEVGLLASAPDPEATEDTQYKPEELQPAPRRPDGVHEVSVDQALFIRLHALRGLDLRLYVGIVAFSDDGNVVPLWPLPGARPTFEAGSVVYVGQDRKTALFLNTRGDQRTSLWTLKVFGYTGSTQDGERIDATRADRTRTLARAGWGGHAINIHGLAQGSLQEVLEAALRPTRAAVDGKPPPELPAWYTWDLRIAVRT